MPRLVLTSQPRTTVSINDGSVMVRPSDDVQASEGTVTSLADRLRVDKSADPGQERMQLG